MVFFRVEGTCAMDRVITATATIKIHQIYKNTQFVFIYRIIMCLKEKLNYARLN